MKGLVNAETKKEKESTSTVVVVVVVVLVVVRQLFIIWQAIKDITLLGPEVTSCVSNGGNRFSGDWKT